MANGSESAGSMNIWSVTSLGIGAMVGAGIFALLGQAALIAGRDTYAAFLLGGGVALLSGYSYARLAARYPDAGGLTTFLDKGFGTGLLSGTLSIMFLLTLAASIAMVARGFGNYAAGLMFHVPPKVWVDGFACLIVIVFVVLNAGNAGLVGRIELALVAVKLVILALLIIAGFSAMAGAPDVVSPSRGIGAVVDTAGLIFLGYSGFGLMTNAAGSVARPTVTIPRAIFLAIVTVMVLYVSLAIVVVDSVPMAEIAHHADTAVAEAARPVFGHAGFVIVSIGALLATASAINSCMFASMQMAEALAHQGHLPKQAFGRGVWGNWTSGGLLSTGVLMVAMVVFDLSALAHITSATFLITYLAVHVVHWRLIDETKGVRWIVAIGAISLAGVLGVFLWSMVRIQPWSFATIVAFIALSGATQFVVSRRAQA